MKEHSVSCVGIIMDGNRRWAKAKGLPKLEGHRAGLETLKKIIRATRDRGIKHLAIFAFSTENWNREPAEVSYLMELFTEAVKKEMKELGKEGVRVHFVGEHERFSSLMQKTMKEVEEETSANDQIHLWCCFSYGGRAEIVHAARSLAQSREEITEATFAEHLWTKGMPDPDIVIRTSGEQRLSGFLPWQTVYSEIFFTNTLWPDFSEAEFDSILAEFAERERRHGK